MKVSSVIMLLLAGSVSAQDDEKKVEYRCDSQITGDENRKGGPLFLEVNRSKAAKDASFIALNDYNEKFEAAHNMYLAAESNFGGAEAKYKLTEQRIVDYHEAYEKASKDFENCQTDNASGEATCTIQEQAVFSQRMVEAGQAMVDNDNEHQKNANIYEQMQLELNQAQSDYSFDQKANGTEQKRLDADVKRDAEAYQAAKDAWEKWEVSDKEIQENCMAEQYNNDMAARERLEGYLTSCQQNECKQAMVEEIDCVDCDGAKPVETDGWLKGKIRFPDCGPVINGECFWKRYNTSGWLDFLSVLSYAPATIGCAALPEYEYSLCFSNFAYVLVDSYTKKAAPPNTDHW